MLGRLGRWLRVLGYDAALDLDDPDAELVRRAMADDRLLLTRDRHLIRELRPPRVLEIVHDRPLDQLVQVVRTLRLEPPRELFTRCLVCNTPLLEVPEAERAALVPAKSRGLPGPVRRCPSCGSIYWHGSHARRMRASIEAALPGWLENAE